MLQQPQQQAAARVGSQTLWQSAAQALWWQRTWRHSCLLQQMQQRPHGQSSADPACQQTR